VLSQVDASSDFRLVEPYETSKNDRMTGEIVGQRTTGLEIVRHTVLGSTKAVPIRHASLQRRQEDLLQEREKQQNEELQRAETERMEAQRQQK